MDLGLKGKSAIVTGSSRGIGRECAIALAGEGARVCVTARDEELLKKAVDDVNAAGGEGMYVVSDLTSLDGCKKVVDATASKFGGVDILINSAGAAKGGDVLDIDVDLFSDALSLKTFGYIRMAQLCVSHMKKNSWGRVINICGGAGASPARGNLPTSFANITVLNASRGLSDAVSGDGIIVNNICPGMTNTQRARDISQAGADKAGKSVEEFLKERGSKIPAGRICEPEEVGRMAAFLASEANSYSMAASIYMDGGARRSTP
ncbi:MAG: SDR family oxidoreductase [Nitrospinaceae bacterium]|mgnify:FL=1|jgi:NAD(P)-dependent dehydrogenase (short-subunit alcohol dehydrogenase family)|nr:SDR family oxidoreductase [Nitrospinaceae bacterium]MBT3821852.1 SDR family oxidoreductase [Nitrospinaceae bacterium]MBT4095838.1 SDR family oxidoreductase [Nitrospinaceae bacterium]MBT4432179.1 SDR family oxidoreductase [Nitrospinaceae bacterium]MBT5949323.1 SDR family oxidoreductase [Nitrospinaceae bacterium]